MAFAGYIYPKKNKTSRPDKSSLAVTSLASTLTRTGANTIESRGPYFCCNATYVLLHMAGGRPPAWCIRHPVWRCMSWCPAFWPLAAPTMRRVGAATRWCRQPNPRRSRSRRHRTGGCNLFESFRIYPTQRHHIYSVSISSTTTWFVKVETQTKSRKKNHLFIMKFMCTHAYDRTIFFFLWFRFLVQMRMNSVSIPRCTIDLCFVICISLSMAP